MMPRHPAATIAIHWVTAIAIVIAVAVMFVHDAMEARPWRQFLLEMHRQLGLLVLVGAAVRILIRLTHGLADHAPDMAPLLRWAAQVAHLLMYGVLIALPLLGWAVTNAHGINLTFLGSVPLPKLLTADSELADTLSDYHVWLAWSLLALVVMHVAAAAWHHFVRRDAVLRAMLPGRRSMPKPVQGPSPGQRSATRPVTQ
jgi:cytochrome b561